MAWGLMGHFKLGNPKVMYKNCHVTTPNIYVKRYISCKKTKCAFSFTSVNINTILPNYFRIKAGKGNKDLKNTCFNKAFTLFNPVVNVLILTEK